MTSSHNSTTILALPANVSEADAFREFRSSPLASLAWGVAHGPLQRIAPFYLPFSLYRLQYQLGSVSYTRFVALDTVEGILDLFEFPEAFGPTLLVPVETRNKIAPALEEDRAESLLRERTLRLVFQQGFFRLRNPSLELRRVVAEFHIPYWLGFYGKDGAIRCRALDAVRRRMEGPKAAQLFERWLSN